MATRGGCPSDFQTGRSLPRLVASTDTSSRRPGRFRELGGGYETRSEPGQFPAEDQGRRNLSRARSRGSGSDSRVGGAFSGAADLEFTAVNFVGRDDAPRTQHERRRWHISEVRRSLHTQGAASSGPASDELRVHRPANCGWLASEILANLFKVKPAGLAARTR